jgi:uncharacterized protein (UPF0261 family)
MRTTTAEMAELGRQVAAKLRDGRGPTVVFVPRGGVSALDQPGQPFHDPDADAACFDAITEGLRGSAVEVVPLDVHINDPAFGLAMAERLHQLVAATQAAPGGRP